MCKLPLSIGKFYQETIVCDVLEMDARHVLLGKPRQFDRDTTHREGNTYSFVWNNKKIVLMPQLDKACLGKPENHSSMFLNIIGIGVQRELKMKQHVLALVLKEVNTSGVQINKLVLNYQEKNSP